MIKLLLSGFLLSISCILNAATVQPTEQKESPIQFLDKKNTVSPSRIRIENTLDFTTEEANQSNLDTNLHNSTIKTQKSLILNTETSHTSLQQDNSDHKLKPKLAEFAVKIKQEYEDSELVQQSLSTFYEAKQFWNRADSQANAFASDIVQNLNLDNLIENDLSNILQPSHNPSISFFLKKKVNFSGQRHTEKSITYNQVRQTLSVSKSGNINTLNNDFVSKLFRMTTVYYLVAFFTIFSLIQWAIKFALRFFP